MPRVGSLSASGVPGLPGMLAGWLRGRLAKAPVRPGAVAKTGLVAAIATAVEARRTFVLIPFAMLGGLIAYAGLPAEPQQWVLAGGSLSVISLLLLLRQRALPLAALALAAWVGVILLPIHGALFGTAMLTRPAYGTFTATVDEVISASAEQRRIVVSGLTPTEGTRPVNVRRARLLVPPEPPLEPGDVIRATLRLAPIPGPVLPGAYDGQFHSYFAGIGAYGTVTSGAVERLTTGGGWDIGRLVEAIRAAIGARIDLVLEGDVAAIGRAMVMGDQSAITDEARDVMAAAGLAHIYSISGLHLAIVAGGLYFLIRLGLAAVPALGVHLPVKRIAAVAGLLAALGYLLLAGGLNNVPALRSTMMLALVFGAVLVGRQALTMRNVAIAAILIILIDPASVFRPSFQLSFAAVVALIGFYEMPRKAPIAAPSRWSTVVVPLRDAAITSLVAGGATLVFSAYHFQQTAPLGVLGNVLVLPVVSLVIMPFAVISVLAMPLGLEAWPVRIMGWGIERMLDIARLVAGWSEGWTGNPLLTGWALAITLAALAWFAFFPTLRRLVGPVLALPLLLLFGFAARPDVLISDTTQAVAVRTATGLGMLTGRTGSFAVDAWGEHYQEPVADLAQGARCDSIACVVATDRFSIAVARTADALPEECGAHDLLIARLNVPAWCGGTVVDAGALARGGVHWLRWIESDARFEVVTAIPPGDRPWRVQLP